MSPLDRDQLETTGAVLGVAAALWAFFKWLVTPLAVSASREALKPELARLEAVATRMETVAERVAGHERRIQMLEDHQ